MTGRAYVHGVWATILLAGVTWSAAATAQAPSVDPFRQSRGISEEAFRRLQRDLSSDALRQAAPNSSAAVSRLESASLRIDIRMVGGVPVEITEAPWQVALIWGHGADPVRVQFCGGSLISRNIVVTAAHCVDRNTPPERVDVVANTTFYKYGGERRKVRSIHIHQGWNPATNENDIAVLRLATDLSQVTPIALALANATIPNSSNLTVTGWGALVEGGSGSELLMGADMPVVDNDTCNRKESYDGRIKAGMMCAGLREGGLDSCQGDSGGPAMVVVNGQRILAGVVSWGEGCARRLKYGVYTRISSYRPWLDQAIEVAGR
jgi:secreted trypsin-like serine protease